MLNLLYAITLVPGFWAGLVAGVMSGFFAYGGPFMPSKKNPSFWDKASSGIIPGFFVFFAVCIVTIAVTR